MAEKPRELLVVYSGQTLGELKPCGCAREEDQGGIERRMTYLKETVPDANDVLLVDAGDNFKDPTPQGKIKARYLMKSMSRMKYDAVTLGEKDLVYGKKFLEELKDIPWVSSNVRFEGSGFPPKYRTKRFADGLKVAMLAVSDPSLFYLTPHSDTRIEDPRMSLETLLPSLLRAERPDIVVALTHMRREEALKLMDVPGIDAVINGHMENENDAIDMEPVRKGEKIFVQAGPKGQKMGELRIAVSPEGGKSYRQRMARLDSSVKFDDEMVKLYEEYDGEIEALFLASRAAKRDKDNPRVYASEKTCMACHPAAHQTWSQSRHSGAYSTLVRVNKAFDPECLACHTTGFDRPGGFISETDTPGLENVQCEVCHGPGLEHAQSPKPGFGAQARQACKQCHVKNHSPRFNFDNYWPRIKH
ncbi:MAG: hypothetical protein HY579_08470 [Nitrospinae bacterium]|nr:hypothetical protein [Nitrospinota bacterium]